jgi:hypothetical protein
LRPSRALALLVSIAFVFVSADSVHEVRGRSGDGAGSGGFAAVSVEGAPPADGAPQATFPAAPPAAASGGASADAAPVFPLGWYDGLANLTHIPEIAREGLDAAMPYDGRQDDPTAYLKQADASHVRVLVEIPRALVRDVDAGGIEGFVQTYKNDPAVLGWYLADEPTVNREVGPLAPGDATVLYDAIKSSDRVHPVAMAFGPGEDAGSYRRAMDVLMFFDYPCRLRQSEFTGLDEWSTQMDAARKTAGETLGFVPVLQGFGRPTSSPFPGNRFPTTDEERYMVFSSLQQPSLGLFFWTLYRSKQDWIDQTLKPTIAVVNAMSRAVGYGPRAGLVTSNRHDVRVASFVDPTTRATYIVATHRGKGTVNATLTLSPSFTARAATDILNGEADTAVKNGKIASSLASYGVAVYRIT